MSTACAPVARRGECSRRRGAAARCRTPAGVSEGRRRSLLRPRDDARVLDDAATPASTGLREADRPPALTYRRLGAAALGALRAMPQTRSRSADALTLHLGGGGPMAAVAALQSSDTSIPPTPPRASLSACPLCVRACVPVSVSVSVFRPVSSLRLLSVSVSVSVSVCLCLCLFVCL